ncbi:MAG: sigma 54-interacting transcriptional regulator [Chlamydiota bacterium]
MNSIYHNLIEPNEFLVHVLNSMDESVVITDLNRCIVYINPFAEKLLGHSAGEILGKKASEFFEGIPGNPPKLADKVRNGSGLEGWEGEVFDRSKNGRIFPVYLRMVVVKDESSNAIGYVGVSREITDEKEFYKTLIYGHLPRRIVYRCRRMRSLFDSIGIVAKSRDTTVLIQGETGTGKQLIAWAVHNLSERKHHNFVDIDCPALPRDIFESELFGHEQGAFTGAVRTKKGLFELAKGGTIFLDEIAEMDYSLQGKLLKVIEDRKFRRIGGERDTSTDVRIITASCKDLKQLVKDGAFKKELFYRLNVYVLSVPPLREREEDIEPLVEYFIELFNKEHAKKIKGVTQETLALLQEYNWPGNVRELRNVIERACLLTSGEEMSPDCLPQELSKDTRIMEEELLTERGLSYDDWGKRIIEQALAKTSGNVSHAARLLGKDRNFVIYRMKKFMIKLPL